jgi:hypothetical protein
MTGISASARYPSSAARASANEPADSRVRRCSLRVRKLPWKLGGSATARKPSRNSVISPAKNSLARIDPSVATSAAWNRRLAVPTSCHRRLSAATRASATAAASGSGSNDSDSESTAANSRTRRSA